MAPQGHIPPAASALGTIGTNAGQYRIWYNWHRKSTEGLPGIMPFLWAAAGVPFGVYNIVQEFNIPLQIQPQILLCLCLICWGQTLFYHNKYSVRKASCVTILMVAAFAASEVLLIFLIRPPYKLGISWPIILIGVVAAILLAGGLIPPYFDFAKSKGRVIGINFIFLSIDFAGGIFSLLALVVQQTFDVLGGTQYIVVVLLEIGIFISHTIWLYRTRRVRREAEFIGMSYDDYVASGEPKVIAKTEKGSLFKVGSFRRVWPVSSRDRTHILGALLFTRAMRPTQDFAPDTTETCAHEDPEECRGHIQDGTLRRY
ncbi:hypothetical protein EV356DRAFT_93270 [Viridothelium virens]|uniref:PQ loop repeat protein n=1 Tax=Viridothelium virens TaxID=1048519 RepID=A0A6A6HCZ6_VIRVR|nr:hypothetical protein EV356DRAFT_93270 [Viridothelium virens]